MAFTRGLSIFNEGANIRSEYVSKKHKNLDVREL